METIKDLYKLNPNINQKQVEQGMGILAAGEADHDPVAVADHAVVGDRAPGVAAQPAAPRHSP